MATVTRAAQQPDRAPGQMQGTGAWRDYRLHARALAPAWQVDSLPCQLRGVSLLLRALVVLLAVPGAALAQNPLPPGVEAALLRAKLPREALGLVVVDVGGKAAPRLVHRAQVPMNPASVDQAGNHLRRARLARAGLHLEHARLHRGGGA